MGESVVGEEFRGALQTGQYKYLARVRGEPMGYIDRGTFDRWTISDAGPDGPILRASIESFLYYLRWRE